MSNVFELEELVKAAKEVWKAHGVFVSAGGTMGAFERHIEPEIYKLGKAVQNYLKDRDPLEYARITNLPIYGIGYINSVELNDKGKMCDYYGMIFGPSPSLQECLDFDPPEDEPADLVEFLSDGQTKPIYTWDFVRHIWIKEE